MRVQRDEGLLAQTYRYYAEQLREGNDIERADDRMTAAIDLLVRECQMPHLAAALEWENTLTCVLVLSDDGDERESLIYWREVARGVADSQVRGEDVNGEHSGKILEELKSWFEGEGWFEYSG